MIGCHKWRPLPGAMLFGLLAGPAGVSAHHPILAKFDDGQPLTISGQVTGISWAAPHAHLFVNVRTEAGAVVNWAIELASPTELQWSGWRPDTLSVGQTISVEGIVARNGSNQIWAERVTVEDGTPVLTVPENLMARRLANRPTGPAPRWPDDQPRLGPAPGATGYWVTNVDSVMAEEGASVEIDSEGLLADIDDASRVAPFQDWALALYRRRQQRFGRDDPLFLKCIPPGGPRQFQVPFGVQFVEERIRDRLFIIYGGGNGNWRLIYTDGRDEVSQVSGNDDNPLFYGHSTASWQGDSLVIDSRGYHEGFWFANGGLPHTNLLQLEERLTRTDLNTLRYVVTVDDPGAYTRPWTASWDLQWMPGEELPESYCQDNRQ